jgi:hypothetical protein
MRISELIAEMRPLAGELLDPSGTSMSTPTSLQLNYTQLGFDGFRGRQTIYIDLNQGLQGIRVDWTTRQVAAILRAFVWAGAVYIMLQPILYPIFAVTYQDVWCFFNLVRNEKRS